MLFFFFKQKTAYEMCGRDWSSDVCSSDLLKSACPKDRVTTHLPKLIVMKIDATKMHCRYPTAWVICFAQACSLACC